MNNASGSALQKASFALLLLIAVALAYLIVRERMRARDEEAYRDHLPGSPLAARTQSANAFPSEMKSSFAPLRPRVETNTVRIPSNRPLAAPPPNPGPQNQTAGNGGERERTSVPANFFDQPVPVATTSGRVSSQSSSSIAGRVTLRGTPPPEKPITFDPMCARLNPAPVTTRHYVVGTEGGLANVFVYIKAGARASKVTQAAIPLLDNINCQFEAYLMGVRAGQPFHIRNSDPTPHNVHALPKVAGNREFNMGLPVTGTTQQKIFDKAEVLVQIKCDVHPWMFAYIGVVDHPWFAVTDADGNFALPAGLPPGEYTLAARHLKAGEALKQISVTQSGISPANFVFDLPENLARTNAP